MFFQAFKVEEIRVALVFSIFFSGAEIQPFSPFHVNKVPSSISENGYISAPEQKLKTLWALSFLIFLIFAQGLRYDYSVNCPLLKIGVASEGCSGLSRGLKFFVLTPDMPCTGKN